MKLLIISVLLTVGVFGLSCDTGSTGNRPTAGSPEIKTGLVPVADDEVAVIEMENSGAYGNMTIELYSNVAPLMVARFKELAREGFYDGTTFHRINQSVIQGGDAKSKDDDPTNDGMGGSTKPNVEAEFSDLKYEAGIVGAARSASPHSANSQFFITLKREAGFDNKYTIFGKVIEGMNNVRTISGVQPREGERPLDAVRIKTIRIEPRK